MRLPALEKNLLKYRALEMALSLFYTQSLKNLIIESLHTTDKLFNQNRFSKDDKKPLQKALKILLEENILTEIETQEIQNLIDSRNDIAHHMEQMTKDIKHPDEFCAGHDEFIRPKYNYDIPQKLQFYKRKIEQGLQTHGYIVNISLDTYFFQHAEQTYMEEMGRLYKKIINQMEKRTQKYELQSQKGNNKIFRRAELKENCDRLNENEQTI